MGQPYYLGRFVASLYRVARKYHWFDKQRRIELKSSLVYKKLIHLAVVLMKLSQCDSEADKAPGPVDASTSGYRPPFAISNVKTSPHK
jgi:hypothetical protein